MQRITGLDDALGYVAQGITNWKAQRQQDQEKEALVRILQGVLGQQASAGGAPAAAGSGTPGAAAASPAGNMGLAGVDPKDLAMVMASKNFDPTMLVSMLKTGGAQKSFQNLSGKDAAAYLGLPSFEGGTIQVDQNTGKVDVVVKPPELGTTKRPTSLGEGWYYDPTDEQVKRFPGYMEDRMALARAGSSSTNVNVSPTAIYKDTAGAAANPLYKASSEAAVATMGEADSAIKELQQIKSLNRTLDGMETGPFTEMKTQALKTLKQMGYDIDPGAISQVETAKNISADLILQRMKLLGGNDTAEERDWIQNATPSVLMTPGGRKTVEYIQERRAKRLDRQASFEGDLAQKVADGAMAPGEARRQARGYAQQQIEEDAQTWNPPKITAGTGAPVVSTGKNAPGKPTPVTSKAEYDALPSGAPFVWKGKPGVKP